MTRHLALFFLPCFGLIATDAGILGGSTTPSIFLVDLVSEQVTPVNGIEGDVNSVSLNQNGIALIGASNGAYTIDLATRNVSHISGVAGDILHVALSESTVGLIDSGPTSHAYKIDLLTNNAIEIPLADYSGQIESIAINLTGTRGLIGLEAADAPIAYSVDLLTNAATLLLSDQGNTSSIVSVALNGDGSIGLLGGITQTTQAYILSLPSNLLTPVTSFDPDLFNILGVAINQQGNIGLLGGQSGVNGAKAYVVDTNTAIATEIPNLTTNTYITHVALDSAGAKGILATSVFPYAYTVDTNSLTATAISGLPSNGAIYSVAIQDSGKAGLIGGEDAAVAFLLPDIFNLPSYAIQLNLGALNGAILSVDFGAFTVLLNRIPTAGLTGANLILANYLNAFASDTASFFMPSYLNGNLAQALESVSPVRNAIPLFALNNNFFAIRQGLTQRASDSRQIKHDYLDQDEISMVASLDHCCYANPCPSNTFWGQLIGFDAYQNRQDLTPRFDPQSIGFVLGYDYALTQDSLLGITGAYMYTHIDQGNHQGHDRVNQEYFSIYNLWEVSDFYANMALWFGFFQIDRVRNIHMDEFDFRVCSSSHGFQVDPHLELGYDYRFCECNYTLEPFVMFDLIHSWQSAYNERGTAPFLFHQNRLHASVFRTEAGLRFYQRILFCSWNLIVEESGSYIYRKPHHIGHFNGFLVGAGGNLILETFTNAQNMGSAGIVFVFEPTYAYYPVTNIGYKGEFGSGFQSHQVSVGFEWSF